MSWSCSKHEIDKGSVNWDSHSEYVAKLISSGDKDELCPFCVEEMYYRDLCGGALFDAVQKFLGGEYTRGELGKVYTRLQGKREMLTDSSLAQTLRRSKVEVYDRKTAAEAVNDCGADGKMFMKFQRSGERTCYGFYTVRPITMGVDVLGFGVLDAAGVCLDQFFFKDADIDDGVFVGVLRGKCELYKESNAINAEALELK